jgi:transposase
MLSSPDSPADPAALDERVTALTRERDVLQSERDALRAENEKLAFLIAQLQRQLFGPRSEKRKDNPDQIALALEDLEQAQATQEEAAGQAAARTDTTRTGPARSRKAPQRNRGALPEHLPRLEQVIEPETKECPCCGGALHRIGEDVSEHLDIVPAQLLVRRIVRPKFACRACTDGVVQMSAPERPLTGGLASSGLVAHVAVQKFAWHLPLYRQAQMLAGQGVDLDRSTLAAWVGRAAWWLSPLYDALRRHVLGRERLFCDETPMPVLDPGRGKTRTSQFWALASDERPFAGAAPPAVFYHAADGRGRDAIRPVLAGWSGVLQVDGFGSYKSLVGQVRGIELAFCWAHARRKFVDLDKAHQLPLAAEMLERIGALYAIEARIRGAPAAVRAEVRQAQAGPVLAAMKGFVTATLSEISGKSPLAGAMRYVLGHWDGLVRYVADGRLEIDTNCVERQMRPIGLGRKNALFAGSEGGARHWALFASLISTAKLNEVDPQTWLSDALERIVTGQMPINRMDELLPWAWKGARQHAAAQAEPAPPAIAA